MNHCTSTILKIQPLSDIIPGTCSPKKHLFISLSGEFYGIFKNKGLYSASAEVAAYKASRFLGFPTVPPIVIRTIDEQTGSLQLFVKTNMNSDCNSQVLDDVINNAAADDLAALKIFCYIFGQFDTKSHNILVTFDNNKNIKLIAIDNEAILHGPIYWKYGKNAFWRLWKNNNFLTSDQEKPFPVDNVKEMKQTSVDEIKQLFGETIPDSAANLLSRYQEWEYVIYQNTLWINHWADSIPFCFSTHYPNWLIERIKTINLDSLRSIFSHVPILSENILNDILDRRDQVLAHYSSLQNDIIYDPLCT